LLIEDDPPIRRLLIRALSEREFAVSSASTGMEGLAMAVDQRPDIVLLDLGLPDIDGLQILAMLRAVSQVPVIVATARDDDASVVRALDAGADDYVVKPFSAEQLEARLRAVLRRTGGAPTGGEQVVVAGLMVDLRAREARLDGIQLDLSPKEFEVLAYLADRPGQVVTKKELLTEVWQQPYGGPDKTVDVHLSWLRRKLGETAQSPRYLQTVRGVGVKLVAPDPPGEPPTDPSTQP
jgi:DNA-binding response OmpR family regulator